MIDVQSIVQKRAIAIVIICILVGSSFAAEKKIEQGGKDFFEAIAIEAPKRQNVTLHEKQPDPKPDLYVEANVNNPQTDIIKYKPMQTESEYRAEIVRLKDYYKPYLRDLTPPYEKTRSRYDLTKFQFRMESADDQADITRVFRGDGDWEDVNIPEYRGPNGWWRGYYRKAFTIPQEVLNSETITLHFGAVSYECDVYINNSYVGGHTGWWAPFELDITKYVNRSGENVLVVLIKNENAVMYVPDGRKIFAAVSQGWDDPNTGWHFSQSGGGIWQEAYIEGRPQLHITDIFVRPDIDKGYVDAIVQVYQPAQLNDGIKMPKVKTPVSLTIDIFPNNFEGEPIRNIKVSTSDAGALFSEYSGRIKIENFRTWELKKPYLYTLRATVIPDGPNAKKDIFQTTFGMRKFTRDDVNVPKGSMYLNNKPIILRGANTMGNMMREYQEGDIDQVVEDILIAKMANMNYWRLTQAPVQPGVYSLCDRLGILTQTDLPLFQYLSRFALEEAIKQAGEMERLVRSHPCNIMITYINEPQTFPTWNRRFLSRYELEEFFKAATAVVHIYNPDRVIKSIDGDFEPPVPASDFPDMHCYNMWYGGFPMGKVHKGYWWPDKPGWKFGCGEYGIEGLEAAETMLKYYPKNWLPANPNDPWNPSKIVAAQTWSTHRNWFDTQETMADWINASQEHQAFGIRMQTRSFRRMKDNVSCAVHLLIDAWPAGWMKTLVDVQRIPKKAYFEFRDALTPLMVDIRTDRTRYYGGEKLNLEFWICNDDEAPFKEGTMIWEVWQDDKRIFAQSCPAQIPSYSPKFAGYFNFPTPKVKERSELTIKVGLKNAGGDYIHASQMKVEVFPEFQNLAKYSALVLGGDKSSAAGLADSLGLTKVSPTLQPNPDIILVSAPNDLNSNWEMVSDYVDKGGTAVLLEQPVNSKWVIGNQEIMVVPFSQWNIAFGRDFVSRRTGHPLVKGFRPFDFAYWYDPKTDCIYNGVCGYLKSELREQKMPEFSASARKFNFAPKGIEVEGFTLSDGGIFDSAKGFGWDKDMRKTMRKRDSSGKPELITGVSVVGETKEAVFSVSLDNGEYAITPVGGDAEYASHFEIYAQDQLLVKKDVAKGEWAFETYKVNVKDGKLDVRLKIDPNRPILGVVMNCLFIEPWTSNVVKRVASYEQASKQFELIPVLIGGINSISVPVVAERKFGKGRFFISQITACDRVQTNPIARWYFERMISQDVEDNFNMANN